MDDVGGSDVSSEAVRGAFAPDASSAETRPGGESGSGGSARGHSETYSDDFGSGDDGISEDGACLNDPVDDAPESPAGKAPSHPGAFATTGDPSAPEEKRQGVHSATRNAPPRACHSPRRPRTAAGTRAGRARCRRGVPSEGAAPDPGRSGASSPRVFRWERSPSPDRRDAAAETGKTTGEVETRRRTDPRGRPSRGGSPRWSRRARRLGAPRGGRGDVSAARAEALRKRPRADRRRRADDGQGARARARRLRAGGGGARERRAHAAAHRERATPELARAMCVRRAVARRGGAGRRARGGGSRAFRAGDDVSEKERRFDARGFARRAPRPRRGGDGGRGRGRGRSRKPGGARVVSPARQRQAGAPRRLWASHRLRRAAAECVGGDAAERSTRRRAVGGGPRWDARRAARLVDETSGGFGEALDAFARRESSEVGRNTVSVLRASAELRRRAGDVLG